MNQNLIDIIIKYCEFKKRIYLVKFITTSTKRGYHEYGKIEWKGVKIAYSKSEAIDKLSKLVEKFANNRYGKKEHKYNFDGKLKSEYKNLKDLNCIMKELTYCDGDNDEFICDIQLVDLDFSEKD